MSRLYSVVIPSLAKAGIEVAVEAGGAPALDDGEYVAKGAKVLADRAEVFAKSDVVIQVLCYGSNDQTGKPDLALMRPGQALIGFLRPLGSARDNEIVATGVTSFSVGFMPRTTRALKAWTRFSMGTICGYKAVLIAADTLSKSFRC